MRGDEGKSGGRKQKGGVIKWGLMLPLQIHGEKDTLKLFISQCDVWPLLYLRRKQEERECQSAAAALTLAVLCCAEPGHNVVGIQ